jgi:hypothetical protein
MADYTRQVNALYPVPKKKTCYEEHYCKPSVVGHAYNPSIQEVEEGELGGQPGTQRKTLS